MAFVDEMLALFQTNSLGTVGTTLFEDTLPDQPDTCAAVICTGGSAPEYGFNVVGIDIEFVSGQIKFRGAPNNKNAPRAQAELAYRLMMTVVAQSLSGVFYRTLRPLQKPFRLEIDTKGRSVWVFNVLAEKKPS